MIDQKEQEYFDRLTLELNGITPEVYVKQKIYDDNWAKLRQEKLTPYTPPSVIEKISRVSLILWANKNYTNGNLQCDVYRNGQKEHYTKNFIFEVTPEMTPRQYQVWDLIMTDAHLSGCQAKRVKFYNKNNAQDYSTEFAHYEIWRNNKLLLAYLLVEDWIISMNISQSHDQFDQSGNIKMTAPWRNRVNIDTWYKANL